MHTLASSTVRGPRDDRRRSRTGVDRRCVRSHRQV